MVLATPHHDPATQAHHAILDVDDARLAPRLEQSMDRPTPVEALDARPEEAARAPPGPPPEGVAAGRHQRARIQPPAAAPDRVGRDEEVEAPPPPAGGPHPDPRGTGAR